MKLGLKLVVAVFATMAPEAVLAQSVGAGHSFASQSSGGYGLYWRQSNDAPLTARSRVCLERKSDHRVFCKKMAEWKAIAASVDAGTADTRLVR